jgi:tetratricopeptide (TPR) repeat protein
LAGNYEDALKNYGRAALINPENDTIFVKKAKVYMALGKHQEALDAYRILAYLIKS